MTSMDCAELAEVAPELALEVLDARGRAPALVHLDGCAPCRQLVSTLAADADLLLLLTPTAAPPTGFADHVVGSLIQAGTPPAPRPRPRLRLVAGLALAACLATFALLLGVDRSTPPALAAADLRTPAGDVVGEVILHPGSSRALFLTMPGWAEQVERYAEPGETYALRIGRAGQAPRVVPFDVADDGTWATSIDTDPDAITSVAVVDTDGDVWCEGGL